MKDEDCVNGTKVILKITMGFIEGQIISKMMPGLVDIGPRRYQVQVLGSDWVISFVEAAEMEPLL